MSAKGISGAALFAFVYVLLDRVSFIDPIGGIGITPWGPSDGVALGVLLLKGRGWVPVVFISALLSSLVVTRVSIPITAALYVSAIIATGYGAAAELLRRLPHFDVRLARSSDLISLVGAALIAPALVAAGIVTVYVAAGVIPESRFLEALTQFWIGDAIGIAVLTPFLLVIDDTLNKQTSNVVKINGTILAESIAQFAVVGLALAIIFGPIGDRQPFKFFYLLCVPLTWIAARRGLAGAVWAVLATQIGVILAFWLRGSPIENIRSFQLLMCALAVTTLLLGAMVSERRRALAALSESEKHLASILDAVPDGVITIDAGERIQSINPAVERLFGVARDRLLGHSVRRLISGAAVDRIRLGPAGHSGELCGECAGRRADGISFPIELSSGLHEVGDQPHQILVVRDITLRREAETRAQAHQAELVRVSRLSVAGEMASALAHELNQPLTAVIAYVQGCRRLMRQQPRQPALLSEGLGEAARQAQRAGDIINHLREFLYDSSARKTGVAVSRIVDAVLDLARPELLQNSIAVRVIVAPDLRLVFVDRIQVEQVLLNLVRNAMEAMLAAKTEQRLITITAKAENTVGVRVTVSDTGPGVPDDVAARLFQPFATTKPQGMGLGLSISRSIVQEHEGDLMMTANSTRGAAFSFTLPGNVDHERE